MPFHCRSKLTKIKACLGLLIAIASKTSKNQTDPMTSLIVLFNLRIQEFSEK